MKSPYVALFASLLLTAPKPATADIIFVTNSFSGGAGTVGKYDASTGATINANFISFINGTTGIAVDNSGHLYVANFNSGVIGEYNANTGAVINANLIFGLNGPSGIALDGSGNLYVVSFNNGVIGKYNANTGAAINANLVSGLSNPFAVDADGFGHLYANSANSVFEYNASSGTKIVGFSVNGLLAPSGIALDGSGHLFVANEGNSKIGEYFASTGATINANFISGLNNPQFIAIQSQQSSVPEPSSLMLTGLGAAALGFGVWRRRQKLVAETPTATGCGYVDVAEVCQTKHERAVLRVSA